MSPRRSCRQSTLAESDHVAVAFVLFFFFFFTARQASVDVHDDRIRAINAQGQALIEQGQPADVVSQRLKTIEADREALGTKLDNRRKEVRTLKRSQRPRPPGQYCSTTGCCDTGDWFASG